MKVQDLLQETYIALSANKARSGLTVLGIIIGIGSVIAMISIGQGASSQIQSSIEGLGSNLLTVNPGIAQQAGAAVSQGRGSAQTLINDDAEALRQINGVDYVSPERQGRYQITSSAGSNTNSTVMGVYPEYSLIRNIFVADGSFITDSNIRSISRVAVLGATLAEDLFLEQNPIGKSIRINRLDFKVVGVLESKEGSGFSNPDDMAYIPLSTMQKIVAGGDYLSSIAISVASKELMAQVQQEATLVLADKHGVDPQSPDFSIISQADIVGAATEVTNTFTILLASIAGISLIVGGIGIMNMMLTTVTERTREIGLRKSIGAKRKNISQQFLVESVILTFIGGLLGIVFGWLISLGVAKFAGIATQISLQAIILAFGVSATIGIIFGYYPARRAAGLNPIEALRYE